MSAERNFENYFTPDPLYPDSFKLIERVLPNRLSDKTLPILSTASFNYLEAENLCNFFREQKTPTASERALKYFPGYEGDFSAFQQLAENVKNPRSGRYEI